MKKYIAILLLLFFAGPAFGATYYWKNGYYEVDAAGGCDDVTAADTAGDIQDAVTAGSAGDTLHMCAGTLGPTDLDSDGTLVVSDNGWTIKGDGESQTILNLSSAAGAAINLVGSDAFVVKDFKVLSGGVTDYPIRVRAGATDTGTIQNLIIDNSDVHNIWIRGGGQTIVQDCTLTGEDTNQSISIDTDVTYPDTDGVIIRRCTLSESHHGINATVAASDGSESIENVTIGGSSGNGNTFNDINEFPIYLGGYITTFDISYNDIDGVVGDTFGRGVELYSSHATYRVSAGDVHHNTIANIADPTVDDTDGAGIGADENTDDVDIHHNIVSDVEGKGIIAYIATNIDVYSNIVIDSGVAGAEVNRAGITYNNSSTGTISNNTIIGGTNCGIYLHSGSTPVLKNNLIKSNGNLPYGIVCSTDTLCDAFDYDFSNINVETGGYYNITSAGSNDVAVDPQLSSAYRSQIKAINNGGVFVSGFHDTLQGQTDFYGDQILPYKIQIGAVAGDRPTGGKIINGLW